MDWKIERNALQGRDCAADVEISQLGGHFLLTLAEGRNVLYGTVPAQELLRYLRHLGYEVGHV